MARAEHERDLSRPGLIVMLGRQVDYWWTAFRRTWKGSVVSYFLQPWLYIAAMGLLLGGYVDDASAGVGGAPSYLDFIAPGLLAATAMQIGTNEAMWPVMGALKWDRTYYGMIATPLTVCDIVAGHVAFAMFRVVTASIVFVGALAVVGIFSSVLGALSALGAALLVGAAFVTPVYAYSAGARNEQGFALIYRLGVMPLFLFSGAFFPVDNLSEPLEWAARLTPLWHGVELCRMSSLEQWRWVALVHVTYLLGLAGLGALLAVRRLTRRLVV